MIGRCLRRECPLLQVPPLLQSPDCPEAGGQNLAAPNLKGRVYRGERTEQGAYRVWIEVEPPDGVENSELQVQSKAAAGTSTAQSNYGWGSSGRGPTELALALLMDALSDQDLALRHFQAFKKIHVARWSDQWAITAEEIRFFVLKYATQISEPPLFSAGSIHATPGVLAEVPTEDLRLGLRRHLVGDWGHLDEHDWDANEQALQYGSRILSAYVSSRGVKFWVITEADRNATTA